MKFKVIGIALLALFTAVFGEETIKIGFFAPLTGPAAPDGWSALNGALLAIDYINARGGIAGKTVELVYYDDALKPDVAVAIARKLIEQDRIVLAVSGSYSGPTRAAASIYQAMKVPMISAYAVHPQIILAGDLIFRVGMGAPVQGIVGAHFAVEVLGAKRIAILTMDVDFGVALSEYFKKKALELGAEIVFEKRYRLGEVEFREILAAIAGTNPDLIWATAYFAEAANIVYQARELGITVPILGQEGYDSPKFIELAGAAAEGVMITTDLDRDSEREIVQWFLREYEKRTGIPADMVGASSFDAIMVGAYAIEKALEETGTTDAYAIAEAINGIRFFEEATTGPFYAFLGREAVRPLTIQIVREGKFRRYMNYTDAALVIPPTL